MEIDNICNQTIRVVYFRLKFIPRAEIIYSIYVSDLHRQPAILTLLWVLEVYALMQKKLLRNPLIYVVFGLVMLPNTTCRESRTLFILALQFMTIKSSDNPNSWTENGPEMAEKTANLTLWQRNANSRVHSKDCEEFIVNVSWLA